MGSLENGGYLNPNEESAAAYELDTTEDDLNGFDWERQ